MRYRRILLKVSGEVLAKDPKRVAEEISWARAEGVEVAVVMGGGNLIRGVEAEGIERETADYMGMMATAINALLLGSFLKKQGQKALLFSSLPVLGVIPPYDREEAFLALGEGYVVLLAGGTGNPRFSTDTAAALRALELRCEVLLKGTKVDGVYEADPVKFPCSKRFDRLTHEEYLSRNLKVMDEMAVLLSWRHGLPILVFDFLRPGGLKRALTEEGFGTLISSPEVG